MRIIIIAFVCLVLGIFTIPLPAAAQTDKDPKPTKEPKLTPTPVYVVVMEKPYERIQSLEIPEIVPASQTAASRGMMVWEPVGTTEEILSVIDEYLVLVWENVKSRQNQYFLETQGRGYMQGLRSHSQTPADGNHEYPDRFLAHPSDWPATWLDMDILPFSPAPYAFVMDTYDGSFGKGYTFCTEIVIYEIMWSRCFNYGGELWRAHTWKQVEQVNP